MEKILLAQFNVTRYNNFKNACIITFNYLTSLKYYILTLLVDFVINLYFLYYYFPIFIKSKLQTKLIEFALSA
ncbi:hypothetical protein Glove_84g17 [Diversispora epigaea]|uniref:Uncharacterized protein n=1 Tax=Diversispora epigaea TaxID=1348612 RepID=A0A397J858_9GLOM|nr:hypothetical protein Glove_84g17 [Diversispora epigaea]